ncbi:acylglycerol lipase [Catalinimonas alkaloidigena]|uniref:alpha/beta hydrolase n=1 Tax=Catalinimonas alkaloidigena TaxID=1075417 RepID=UPI0024071E2D|nr:alpha/beta hydrolase [Catalinimonas alkaloidigena]MDF9794832.1 acylglycerol lipase [Catalinimonas alkaloidigena]
MSYQNTQDFFYTPKDNCKCFWQKWIPEAQTQRTIVFQHGLGEHSNRYTNLINYFAGSGTAFYAMDARGHGQSEGKRGHVSSLMVYVEDLHELIKLVTEEQGVKQVLLMGHSLGGTIAALYAITYQKYLQALILSSAGIEPHLNTYTKLARAAASGLIKLAPSLTLGVNLNLKYISHDKEMIADYKADPLVHGYASVRLGYEMFKVHETLYAKAPQLRIPLYVIHGTGDKITMPKGSQKFYELAGSEDKTIKFYDKLFHEMINEIPVARDEVLRNLRQWVERRVY